jgi:hypothetical protein
MDEDAVRAWMNTGELIWIEPPFLAAYGSHVYMGDGF